MVLPTGSTFDFDTWCDLIEKATMIGFDWEATGVNPYDGTDVGRGFSISVAINNDPNNIISEYFGVSHLTESGEFDYENNLPEDAWKYLMTLVCSRPAVCHNVIYDMAVSRNAGFELTKVVCTMKFNHLLNENHPSYSLEEVSKRTLGYNAKQKSPVFEMAMLAYGWAGMPFKYMRDYALADAGGTLKVILLDMRNARNKGEKKLFSYWTDIEAPATVALSHMRKWGVEIDTALCREQELLGLSEKERITEEFGFNPGSTKGLAKLLLEELELPVVARTEKGAPQFDKKAMERYEVILSRDSLEDNSIVKNLLTYRGWTKSVSSYYSAYQKLVSSDGRLRPEYRTTGTVTGRWSCADPNLQQIPKETDKVWNGHIKDCIVSANGYTGWEIDYAQLEFRLAARASHSLDLVEIFNDPDRDIFNEMAASLTWERNPTKVLTYSTLYGAGVQRIMDAFGVSPDEARNMLDHFYDQYPHLRSASKQMEFNAKKYGYVEIWSGRRRHFRNPQKEAFKAFNSYIQGGAADIVKGVMVALFKEVINEDCKLLLQVHDSLWFEIKNGMEEYYLPKIMEIMRRPSKKFGVLLDVDAHPWSRREGEKYGKELVLPKASQELLGMLTV